MKHFFPMTLLFVAFVYLTTTGFQCGSAETTSAKLYMQQKQWQKAEESLLKETQKNDKDEEAWYLLGQVRLELKNYKGMNDAFTKALGLSDAHRPEITRNRLAIWAVMYNDGVGYYNKGKENAANYDSSLVDFNTAISLVPDSAGTYYVAALTYYAKKDNNSAMQELEIALQKKPDFTEAARFLGQLHYMKASERIDAKDEAGAQAEYQQAAVAFRAAYKADPNNPDNITNLIDVYERTKNSEMALQLTSEAVKKDPNNKVFRYAYGVFLLKQDKYAESIQEFTKVLELDPAYTDATYNLGVAYLNWGVSMKVEADKRAESDKKGSKGKEAKEDTAYKEKFRAALPYLEKVAGSRKDDALLWQQLGKIYANLNMVDKSKAAFEQYDRIVKGK